MSRLKKVMEGRIKNNILKLRKKVKGDLVMKNVFEVVEKREGVYVNRSLICDKLRKEGWVKSINGVDVLVEEKVKMVNRDK